MNKYRLSISVLSKHTRDNSGSSNQLEVNDAPELSPRVDKEFINFMVKDEDDYGFSYADPIKVDDTPGSPHSARVSGGNGDVGDNYRLSPRRDDNTAFSSIHKRDG